MLRDICCWFVLSCSMPALSCSTSCPRLARSRAIDCSNSVESDAATTAGAAVAAALRTGGAVCGGVAVAASPWTAGGAGRGAGPRGFGACDTLSMSCVASLAVCFVATSPYDFQATAATPMHAANSNAMEVRTARLAIDQRPDETRTASWEAGRNVVSTGGAVGPAGEAE